MVGHILTLLKNSDQAKFHKKCNTLTVLGFTFNQKTLIDFLLCKFYCVEHHMNQCELGTKNNAKKKYYRMTSVITS